MSRLSALHTHLLTVVRRLKLFEAEDTLIVGLSGGADSVALLDLLATLPGYRLRLIAAHLNHSLRGDESDADEAFCRSLAEQYAIPCETRRINVAALTFATSRGLEDAGRKARREFFEELAERYGAHGIVLAHHADDQAETVLMRLLRGAGSHGLAAMNVKNGRYLRPLLDVRRSRLEEHLNERGLAWREDSSNRDTVFLRNRIRHELLPLLETYNPSIYDCLNTTSGLLADESCLLDELAHQAADSACSESPDGWSCSIPDLAALHPALQRRLIRLILARTSRGLDFFTSTHIEDIRSLALCGPPNGRLTLPRSTTAIRAYDRLTITSATLTACTDWEMEITAPGRYQLPDGGYLEIGEATREDTPAAVGRHTIRVDLDKAPFPWLVRSPRSGDRLAPVGMQGHKKLKDIFIDDKIPLQQRHQTPVVLSRQEIIWACGLRASRTVQPDSQSTRIVELRHSPGTSQKTPI